MKIKITESQYKNLTEDVDGVIDTLMRLILSGSESNISMAMELAKGQDVDLKGYLSEMGVIQLIQGLLPYKQFSNLVDALVYIMNATYLPVQGLTEIPLIISKLPNLVDIKFNRGSISSIPEWFCDLTYLEYVGFNYNNISDLPESFVKLTDIRELNIRSCKLTKIPKVIYKMPWIRYLSLDGNSLSDVNELCQLGKVTKYKEINIGYNEYAQSDYNALTKCFPSTDILM